MTECIFCAPSGLRQGQVLTPHPPPPPPGTDLIVTFDGLYILEYKSSYTQINTMYKSIHGTMETKQKKSLILIISFQVFLLIKYTNSKNLPANSLPPHTIFDIFINNIGKLNEILAIGEFHNVFKFMHTLLTKGKFFTTTKLAGA